MLRAALVTRELRIISSAQQTFEIRAREFDPLEAWYKMKKVIAACLDIGRTQSREIAGVAIVSQDDQAIQWSCAENEITARGILSEGLIENSRAGETYFGNMRAWLLWNLTGVFLKASTEDFGRTRPRSPFDAELPVLLILSENDALEHSEKSSENDGAMRGAARCAWEKIAA